jgi:hypothetical protein
VLLGTPFAAFGAFLGLYLMRFVSESYVNNVFAQIGLVMLIGLAAKNAILIVEFARAKMHEGHGHRRIRLEGAKLRFRPILMTAFAFILGVVPLVRASGAGAEGAQGDGDGGLLRHARRDHRRRHPDPGALHLRREDHRRRQAQARPGRGRPAGRSRRSEAGRGAH